MTVRRVKTYKGSGSDNVNRDTSRTWLVAAVIGLAAMLAGCGGQAAAPTTISVTETPTPRTVVSSTTIVSTVNVTVTPPPVTVAVTVTPAVAAANADPAGPKANGNYLVGKNIAPGNWQCSSGDDSTFWRISDQSAKTINNGFSTIAAVTEGAFTADLLDCKGTWSKVG